MKPDKNVADDKQAAPEPQHLHLRTAIRAGAAMKDADLRVGGFDLNGVELDGENGLYA
jgi:hypothetical protein